MEIINSNLHIMGTDHDSQFSNITYNPISFGKVYPYKHPKRGNLMKNSTSLSNILQFSQRKNISYPRRIELYNVENKSMVYDFFLRLSN